MVDVFFVSGEAFGAAFPAGPILVAVPSGVLSFEEYLELTLLKAAYAELSLNRNSARIHSML